MNKSFLKEVELLDLLVSQHASEAIAGYKTLNFLSAMFYQNKSKGTFKHHTANNYFYRLLEDSSDLKLVNIFELANEMITAKDRKNHLQYSNFLDLMSHRDYISHGSTYRWTDNRMKNFTDKKRQYSDDKAQFIWNFKKSLENDLSKYNSKSKNILTLQLTQPLLDIANAVLLQSVKLQSSVPPVNILRKNIEGYFSAEVANW